MTKEYQNKGAIDVDPTFVSFPRLIIWDPVSFGRDESPLKQKRPPAEELKLGPPVERLE